MKLSGRMSGKPITLPGRHGEHRAVLRPDLLHLPLLWSQSQLDFWLIVAISLTFGS